MSDVNEQNGSNNETGQGTSYGEFDPKVEGVDTTASTAEGDDRKLKYRRIAEALLKLSGGTGGALADVLMGVSHCSVKSPEAERLADVLMGVSHCSVKSSETERLADVLSGSTSRSAYTDPIDELIELLGKRKGTQEFIEALNTQLARNARRTDTYAELKSWYRNELRACTSRLHALLALSSLLD